MKDDNMMDVSTEDLAHIENFAANSCGATQDVSPP